MVIAAVACCQYSGSPYERYCGGWSIHGSQITVDPADFVCHALSEQKGIGVIMYSISERRFPGKSSLSLLRQRVRFSGSAQYWEDRYAQGSTSGLGSYGEVAQMKANFINSWVKSNDVSSVSEFGCGDGNQLSLAEYPTYIGLDVSRTAILLCKERFVNDKTKSFYLYDGECFIDNGRLFRSDLVMSLDVIYHLVEDIIFETYMGHLFATAKRHVIIYSTDAPCGRSAPHVKHRNFSAWVRYNYPEWQLALQSNGPRSEESQADFFVYEKVTQG